MLGAVFKQLLLHGLARFKAGLEHHKRLYLLYLIRIGHAYNAAHVHGLVRIEYVFHLGRINIVAAGYYHALYPLAEIDEAILVHHAKVARVHICAPVVMHAHGLGGFLGVVAVFKHYRGAGKADFAFFAIGQLLCRADLDYFIERIRERYAYAAFAAHVIRR